MIKWGEAVSAHIKLEPGSTFTESDILVTAKSSMGDVKAPKQVTFVEDFPRTPVGKIDRKSLLAAAWQNVNRTI